MFAYILSGLIFTVTMMLQYGIVSRTPMLSGTADLMVLVIAAWSLHQNSRYFWVVVLIFGAIVSAFSAVPLFLPLLAYGAVYFAANGIRLRVWQTPLLSMFLLTFGGTLFLQGLYMLSLFIEGVSFSLSTAFTEIILPSVFLNILLAIPVHALIQEVCRSLYRPGMEI